MHVFSKVTTSWVKLRIAVLVLLGCLLLLASGAQAFPLLAGDVALGKTAKADKTWNSAHVASYATDGTPNFWNAADWSPHWLEIDLGQVYSLSQVDLSYPCPTGGVNFNLYYSTNDNAWSDAWSDNTNWTFIASGSLALSLGHDAIVDFNNQEVRYLKYAVTSTGDWVGVEEIAAYGRAVPAPEPFTIVLLGAGLAGLGLVRRRMKK